MYTLLVFLAGMAASTALDVAALVVIKRSPRLQAQLKSTLRAKFGVEVEFSAPNAVVEDANGECDDPGCFCHQDQHEEA